MEEWNNIFPAIMDADELNPHSYSATQNRIRLGCACRSHHTLEQKYLRLALKDL